MTTYQSLRQKIRSCTSPVDLRALEPVIERHYNNNTITMKQFALLDAFIMERIAEIEK